MTTSGTSAFNLDVTEIVEEAFERVGVEVRTGYHLRTARRSLNLLTLEWANRGVNFWTIEQGSIPLAIGQIEYDLPSDTIDLIDTVVRTGTGQQQSDISISRISVNVYANIPNKNALGRPVQYWLQRRSGATEPGGAVPPRIHVYQAPQNNDYTLVYWRLRRLQDAGTGVETQDIPFRFLPALIAGLAFHLAVKTPEAADRIPMLEQAYEKAWALAAEEDREKGDYRISPRVGYG